jgi:cytochrome c biogenesis protein CcmG/thiol:disulfide interchange protein DsbE
LLLSLPLGVIALGGAAFYAMLNRMEQGKFDPHDIGNPLLGHDIPDFSLPGLDGAGFSAADIRKAAQAGPVMLNFFASWCVPCANEAPVLAALAQSGVKIWGIAYKDKPEAVQKFFANGSNPFAYLAMDAGRVAIDFGLSGVPETFIVGRNGKISWHIAGPIDDSMVTRDIMPRLQK